VLADLDPQLAGDNLVDRVGEPAQPTGDQRGSRYQQPGKCDERARIVLGQAPKPYEYGVPLGGSRVLHPARQNHEVVDDCQRPLNVLPTRPLGAYFLHVRGVAVIDAQALRNAHHAAPSCPPGVGRQVGVQALPDRGE
jgi:hypothetical protein